jgi:hypothetical protein
MKEGGKYGNIRLPKIPELMNGHRKRGELFVQKPENIPQGMGHPHRERVSIFKL